MQRSSLGELTRRRYDLLVVGGGIYGAMVARDAALRGLDVALVERADFGEETSHNSMKVMHGGIRYVQHLDFARLRASARERAFWQRAAPDHVRPLDFVMPLFGHGVRGPLAFAGAAAIYNAATTGLRGPGYPGAGVIGPAKARDRLGPAAVAGVSGGGIWRDGQVLDANRLQIACVAAATEQGAAVANHMEVTELAVAEGRVAGAWIADRYEGGSGLVEAEVTIVAAGPGTAELVRSSVPDIPEARFPRFARATNLVLGRVPPLNGVGFVSRSPSDAVVDRGGRLYFLTPWQGRTILGTHESADDTEAPPVSAFLDEVNTAVPEMALRREEVVYIYSGRIPADVDDPDGRARRRTRGTLVDHRVADGVGGLVSLVGIKYTTARSVAERAVDLATAQLSRGAPASGSLTTPLPKVAAIMFDPDDPAAVQRRVAVALEEEMASTLADVVVRRTQLAETGALSGEEGRARLHRIAAAMASRLGWETARTAREVAEVSSWLDQRI